MGRIVVITGGTSGIGKACAEYFESKGETVLILSRKNPENLKNFYECDVAVSATVKKVFDEIGKKYGHIDVLINNAGHGVSGATELISEADAKNIFDVNFFGVLNCTNSALPYMKKGGIIINMSSVLAYFPVPFKSFYNSSKAAVSMLTHSQAAELKPAGINVVAVCPGDVKSNLSANRIKVFDTNERYGQRVQNAAAVAFKPEEKRMDPILVAKACYKLSVKKHPKPSVIVGFKYKLLYCFYKFMPIRWFLGLSAKMFGGRKEKRGA